jgi:uncharacterized OsmC-like protein
MYQVKVSSSGGYHFEVKAKEHTFMVDMKGNAGVTPLDAFLAALGSCLGVYLRKYIENAKLALEQFSIDLTADLSKEAPISFRNIAVSIDLKGAKLDRRRIQAILEFIKNCPVHNTLKNGPEVEIRII